MENTLAVLSCTGQSISFFDIHSGKRTGHLPSLVAEPHELCHDGKRNVLYASHTYRDGMYAMYSSYSHEISIIDYQKQKVVDIIDVSPAEAPHDFAIDSSKDILWVTVEKVSQDQGGGLIGIDLGTHKVIKSVECQFETHWFIMTPDGKKAYTCNKTAPFVSILDLENEKMIGKIDVDGTEQPALSRCGRYLFFPTPSLRFGSLPEKPGVLIIDSETDKILRTVPLSEGYGPASVHVTPDGKIMVAQYCFDTTKKKPINGRVSVFDPKFSTLLGEVEAGSMPITMRATADGRYGFVAHAQGGTVIMIDLETFKVIRTLDVDPVPSALNKNMATAHGMALISV